MDKVSNVETADETGNSPFPDGLAEASGGFSCLYTRGEVSVAALIDSIGCRTLIPGEATLFILVSTLQNNYSYEAAVAQAVLANLTLSSLGEQEEVFTSGRWRIGLAAAARRGEGLGGKAGLWGACTAVHGKAAAPSPSPSASPAATPSAIPGNVLLAPAAAPRG